MELSDLRELLEEAGRLTKHTEFVVVGSLSILGLLPRGAVPPQMLISLDVDCYTRQDPGRIFELKASLGEGSEFDASHGFYLDPVSPDLPTLPAGWQSRLIRVPLGERVTAFFLDPDDAAVSKYARGDARDREWIRAGLEAGLLQISVLESRFRDTDFLDAQERDRARRALAEDREKFTPGSGGK